ncbi:MAG: hypothetical protein QM695_13890 [Micropruina sp.]
MIYVPVGLGSGICAHLAVRDLLGAGTEIVGVADAEQAIRIIWQTTHQMPEPAGALSLAGLLGDTGRAPGATAAVIMSGGNCDTELVLRVLGTDDPAGRSGRPLVGRP